MGRTGAFAYMAAASRRTSDRRQGAGQRLPDRRHADHEELANLSAAPTAPPTAATRWPPRWRWRARHDQPPAFLAASRSQRQLVATLNQITDYPQVFTPCAAGLLLGLVAEAFMGRSKDIRRPPKHSLMVLIAGTEVLRLAPALIVSDAQIAERRFDARRPRQPESLRPARSRNTARRFARPLPAFRPKYCRIEGSHVRCPSGELADIVALEALAAVTMPCPHFAQDARQDRRGGRAFLASLPRMSTSPARNRTCSCSNPQLGKSIVGTAAIYASPLECTYFPSATTSSSRSRATSTSATACTR